MNRTFYIYKWDVYKASRDSAWNFLLMHDSSIFDSVKIVVNKKVFLTRNKILREIHALDTSNINQYIITTDLLRNSDGRLTVERRYEDTTYVFQVNNTMLSENTLGYCWIYFNPKWGVNWVEYGLENTRYYALKQIIKIVGSREEIVLDLSKFPIHWNNMPSQR